LATSRTNLVKSVRSRVARYPAKMVHGLASKLVSRYALDCQHFFDPFCGSGELLFAAARSGYRVTGLDINPFATLLTKVRIEGFDVRRATQFLDRFLLACGDGGPLYHLNLDRKTYWFSQKTLSKIENMRYVAKRHSLHSDRESRSVLLALALAIRLCSRADDRSPKPFISKEAIRKKRGKHLDPKVWVTELHIELCRLYGGRKAVRATIKLHDVATPTARMPGVVRYSHAITSPPYLNAQDYFRNFKFEIALLNGLWGATTVPAESFIGTERGALLDRVTLIDIEVNRRLVPQLSLLEKEHPKLASVVHRYLVDMRVALLRTRNSLTKNGILVIVCGDNLIGSVRIKTWEVLNTIIESMGFEMFDSFQDRIRARALAPKRSGHKGLIKEERVSAFRLIR
jgi:D12 class N6 adenine-specific DNA methyltransferase